MSESNLTHAHWNCMFFIHINMVGVYTYVLYGIALQLGPRQVAAYIYICGGCYWEMFVKKGSTILPISIWFTLQRLTIVLHESCSSVSITACWCFVDRVETWVLLRKKSTFVDVQRLFLKYCMHFSLTFCSVNKTQDFTPGNEKFIYSFSPCQPMSCYPGQPDSAAVSCVHVSLVKVIIMLGILLHVISKCRLLTPEVWGQNYLIHVHQGWVCLAVSCVLRWRCSCWTVLTVKRLQIEY